jgi:uncharacterized delta-60 repeat protein
MPTFSHALRCEPLEDRTAPAAGDLDPTFGTGGTVLIGGPPAAGATAAAALPDGSILVAGFSQQPGGGAFAAAKLRPDGSLDPAFGAGGVATVAFPPATIPGVPDPLTDSRVSAVAVHPDGRIVLAGRAPANQIGVARLNADGTPDPSFGTNGSLTLQFGQISDANAVAVQQDGRIVLAGAVFNGGEGSYDFLAVRLNPNGALDPTFSGDGLQTVAFDLGTLKTDVARGVAVQPDGRIVLVGEAQLSLVDLSVSLERDFALVRLNPDGSPDPTFDGDGRLTFSHKQSDTAAAVALRPDGRVVVGGTTGSSFFLHGLGGASFDFAVLRFNADGSLDPTFGAGGLAVIPLEDPSPTTPGFVNRLNALAVQSTGKVVVAGFNNGLMAAARLNPDGTPDGTFGAGGLARPLAGEAQAVLAAPLGRIVLAGTTTRGTPGDPADPASPAMAVVRLLGDPIGPGAVAVGGRPDGTATIFSPVSDGYQAVDALAYFPGFAGTVRTAVADVTGDDTPDYVGGAGPGGGPNVVVFDGKTGGKVADFYAFEVTFTGGVFVAAGDLDGDGTAEVVVTPDRGGGPVVAVFDGSGAERGRFLGIEDPAFRGGARPALGDLTGDGAADLVVSAGFLGGPRIALFDGRSVAGGGGPVKLVADFFAFESTLRNGAFVAAGDVDGDGVAEVAFGGGPGGAPRVRLFDGKALLTAGGFSNLDEVPAAQLANFFAGDTSLRGGVRLILRDADGDGRVDLIAGSGEGEPSRVRVFRSATLLAGPTPAADQDLDPFGGAVLAGGVFVG